ncbi:MAG: hypothetical protein WCH34_14845 [Bacteroidota bacterium]
MKESSLHNQVLQKLNEFESLEPIEVSDDWRQIMKERLSAKKPHLSQKSSKTLYIALLFIVLINMGFMLRTLLHNSGIASSHSNDLQQISKELLINTESIYK